MVVVIVVGDELYKDNSTVAIGTVVVKVVISVTTMVVLVVS